MFRKSTYTLIGVAIFLAVLAACAPAPTPAPTAAPPTAASKPAEPTKGAAAPTAIPKVAEPTKMPEPTKAPVVSTPTKILVWSHFANEPLMRKVIQTVFDEYMAKNPNVKIEVVWWEKAQLVNAIRTAMSAGGTGAPDLTTFDTADVSWVNAGWLLDIETALPWDKYVTGADKDGVYAGVKGHYKHNMAFAIDYLLYNPKIFDKLGVKVPANRQFTQDEFLDVVKKCKAAGYAGMANAIGDRPYPGQYVSKAALLNLVGADEYEQYITGQKSWDTPAVRQVLQWVLDLGKAGLWPESFSTMTLDELHIYFHTQQKACMLYLGSFFPSRSFKPVNEGGMPRDFRFNFLLYPKMNGAKGNNLLNASFPTGYAVLATSKNTAAAKDILRFWASNPRYGAMWEQIVNMPSAIKYKPEDIPADLRTNEWQWYWDEFNKAYGSQALIQVGTTCAEFNDALTSVLNQGIPLGLVTVDEAIKKLDAKLCKK